MAQIAITPVVATISAGSSLSAAAPLGVGRVYGVLVPAGWIAANLTFQISDDGGVTWDEMYDGAGNEVSVTVAAAQYVAFNLATVALFAAINMIKIRSGSAAAPVAQSAGATLTFVTQPF